MANMKFAAIILIILTAMNISNCLGDENTADKNTFNDYKIIAKKNIFSRQRISPKPKTDGQAEQTKETFVLEAFILRGTAINDGKPIAFVENVFDSQVYHLTTGEEFKGSLVKEILDNKIVITKGDDDVEVFIGEQFNGDKQIRSDEQTVKSVQMRPASDAAKSDEQSDILKKMMERRKKQLSN